jgi:exodeoxyribonuclease V alpha subunit
MRRIVHAWAEHAYVRSGFAEQASRFCWRVEQAAEQEKELRDLLRLVERHRLLTLLREGSWGCIDINRQIEQLLRPKLVAQDSASVRRMGQERNPVLRWPAGRLFPGAIVLVTQNDHDRSIYNGDVGLAVHADDGGLRVVFSRQGEFLVLPADALPSYELGFAMTVHKSQGSEYAEVLVVLPPAEDATPPCGGKQAGTRGMPSLGKRLLTKELIYTGITRAKQRAVICSTPAALRLAISRKCQRESGILGFWDSPLDFLKPGSEN